MSSNQTSAGDAVVEKVAFACKAESVLTREKLKLTSWVTVSKIAGQS